MVQIGYALSSEEHSPNNLIRNAQRAEELGFPFALISDHFHPWIDKQGHSPFVWSVIGGIAAKTERLRLGTGVTCPTIRTHPAIIAQAAATAAAMMPGRFFLGVGTGENLNEHILGDRWPAYEMRREMLREAVKVIRILWEGGTQTYYGDYYTLEDARIYTLPDDLPPIMIAAAGEQSAELADQIGDGLITVSADAELVETFRSDEKDRPCYGQMSVCCAEDEDEARQTAYEWWPTAGMPGQMHQELPSPALFEMAAQNVTEDDVAESVVCGNDPDRHLENIQSYIDAGFDYVYIHQIGPDQEAFFRFYAEEILPKFH